MKKRTIAITMATMLAIAITACGDAADTVDGATAETVAVASAELTTEEPTAESTPEYARESVTDTAEAEAETIGTADTGGAEEATTETMVTEVEPAPAPMPTEAPTAAPKPVVAAEPTEAPVLVAANDVVVGGIVDGVLGNDVVVTGVVDGVVGNCDVVCEFDSVTAPAQPEPVKTVTTDAHPAPQPAAPAAAPAAPAASAHVHDWQPTGKNVYGDPWVEVVGEHEETAMELVSGSRCLLCGYESEHHDMSHVRNCWTWIETERGQERYGGMEGFEEMRPVTRTVQDTIVHGGDLEFQQDGWVCTSCGATKGMDE